MGTSGVEAGQLSFVLPVLCGGMALAAGVFFVCEGLIWMGYREVLRRISKCFLALINWFFVKAAIVLRVLRGCWEFKNICE